MSPANFLFIMMGCDSDPPPSFLLLFCYPILDYEPLPTPTILVWRMAAIRRAAAATTTARRKEPIVFYFKISHSRLQSLPMLERERRRLSLLLACSPLPFLFQWDFQLRGEKVKIKELLGAKEGDGEKIMVKGEGGGEGALQRLNEGRDRKRAGERGRRRLYEGWKEERERENGIILFFVLSFPFIPRHPHLIIFANVSAIYSPLEEREEGIDSGNDGWVNGNSIAKGFAAAAAGRASGTDFHGDDDQDDDDARPRIPFWVRFVKGVGVGGWLRERDSCHVAS